MRTCINSSAHSLCSAPGDGFPQCALVHSTSCAYQRIHADSIEHTPRTCGDSGAHSICGTRGEEFPICLSKLNGCRFDSSNVPKYSACRFDVAHMACVYSGQVFPECRLSPTDECGNRASTVSTEQYKQKLCESMVNKKKLCRNEVEWLRPEATTEWPCAGTYVFIYVAESTHLVPSQGFSDGSSVQDFAGRKVIWWLSGLQPPPNVPRSEYV